MTIELDEVVVLDVSYDALELAAGSVQASPTAVTCNVTCPAPGYVTQSCPRF